MPNIFGLDIAKIVNDSIKASGGILVGTLTKITPGTRTIGDPTAGVNPTTTEHTISCIIEVSEKRMKSQLTSKSPVVISILGASINPVTVPEVNDEVTVNSVVYTLTELINLDTAQALYEFKAEN